MVFQGTRIDGEEWTAEAAAKRNNYISLGTLVGFGGSDFVG